MQHKKIQLLIFCNARICVTDTILCNKNFYFVFTYLLNLTIFHDVYLQMIVFITSSFLNIVISKFYEQTNNIAIVLAREIDNHKN